MIRRATPADASIVKSIRLRALSTEPAAYGTTHDAAMALSDDVWAERLRPHAFPTFLSVDAAGVHGMAVGAHPVVGQEHDVAFLYAMWVEPSHRGRGAGAALVDAVCGWAAGRRARVVRLHVADGNDAAERLYRRCGFSRTGSCDVRDRDGATEWEMELEVERLSRPAAPEPARPRDRG